MERTLWHLTLDTMHVARTPRSDVADHVVEHLAGVLARASIQCRSGKTALRAVPISSSPVSRSRRRQEVLS